MDAKSGILRKHGMEVLGPNTVGYRRECPLALAIESLGSPVVWERENRSKARLAHEKRGKQMFREIMADVMEELKTKNGGTENG